MNADEPLALEPARGLSPLGSQLLVGALAFVAGVGGTAGLLYFYGPARPAQPLAAAAPAAQVQTPPAAALPARHRHRHAERARASACRAARPA
ncbi:MAG: hypothetical protein WDN44_07980 [Sphingomonas sp.]